MNILLVEDTPEQAQIVECYLGIGLPDSAVGRVGSLEETLDSLNSAQYDAILLDLGLPDSSGLSTVIEVHRAAPEIPVVVLTSAGEDGLGVLCLQAGAHDFLDKAAVTPQTLQKALSFASARKSEEANLGLQRELEAIELINPNTEREFAPEVRQTYQSFLVTRDASPRAAKRLVRSLLRNKVKHSQFLSLHQVALTDVAGKLPGERLGKVVGSSSHLALSVMTVVTQLLAKKKKRKKKVECHERAS